MKVIVHHVTIPVGELWAVVATNVRADVILGHVILAQSPTPSLVTVELLLLQFLVAVKRPFHLQNVPSFAGSLHHATTHHVRSTNVIQGTVLNVG